MTKEFYYHDVKMIITSDTDKNYKLYKVELTDRNGFQSTIYERNFNDAIEYAKYYFDTTEKRKNSYDSIGSMIELDKKNGIKPTLD